MRRGCCKITNNAAILPPNQSSHSPVVTLLNIHNFEKSYHTHNHYSFGYVEFAHVDLFCIVLSVVLDLVRSEVIGENALRSLSRPRRLEKKDRTCHTSNV
jgi:hypothetical protein